MTDNLDLGIMVGRLDEGLERLTKLVEDEKEQSSKSRSAVHRRLDDQMNRMVEMDKAIQRLVSLEARLEAVEADAKVIRKIKTVGGIASFVMVSLGISAAGMLVWASEFARAQVLHWLGLAK